MWFCVRRVNGHGVGGLGKTTAAGEMPRAIGVCGRDAAGETALSV